MKKKGGEARGCVSIQTARLGWWALHSGEELKYWILWYPGSISYPGRMWLLQVEQNLASGQKYLQINTIYSFLFSRSHVLCNLLPHTVMVSVHRRSACTCLATAFFFARVILSISTPTETAVCYFCFPGTPVSLHRKSCLLGPAPLYCGLFRIPAEYRAAAGITFNMSSVALPELIPGS